MLLDEKTRKALSIVDPFSGYELRRFADEESFGIYSVGDDGQDDGGSDHGEGTPDVALRLQVAD